MKTRIFNLLVVLAIIVLFTASIPNNEFSISLGDEFISAKSGENLEAVSQKLSMTTAELNSYFTDNGLLYLAVTDDAKTQIKISTYCDNFSSEVSDIANLNDEMLNSFIDSVSKKSNSPATIVLNGDRKFLCVKEIHKDTGGVYTVTQYITICNNKTYYFVGYNDGEDTSDRVNSAFENFEVINLNAVPATNYTPQMVLIIAGIVVFSIIALLMIVGIIRNSHKDQGGEENDQTK